MSKNSTLKLVEEYKIHSLLPGCPAGARLEASGVLFFENNFYVVFDNRIEVALLSSDLSPPESVNSILGVETYEEGYEGISYNPKKELFYLLIEAKQYGKDFQPVIVEAKRTDNGLEIINKRCVDIKFKSDNKGFEALSYFSYKSNDYVLGLCEGNKCKSGKAGRKPGGGRICVFKKRKKNWVRVSGKHGTIKLPESVRFQDYSAMSVLLAERRFAILSQENSEMWIGEFDHAKWKWVDDGKIYRFPRSQQGEILYGNVEGVAWITPKRLAIVSDIRKSEQDPSVEQKDQSIHIFDLPK